MFISFSAEVTFAPFVSLAPVIKWCMVLLTRCISTSSSERQNKPTIVATMQTIAIGNSSSSFLGPSVILEENRDSYFWAKVPWLPVKKNCLIEEMMQGWKNGHWVLTSPFLKNLAFLIAAGSQKRKNPQHAVDKCSPGLHWSGLWHAWSLLRLKATGKILQPCRQWLSCTVYANWRYEHWSGTNQQSGVEVIYR